MKQKLRLFASLLLLAVASAAWGEDFTLSSADAVTQNGITVSFAKGSGTTAPTWYAAGLRFYASNTITISSERPITGITFNWEKQGNKDFNTATADIGDYVHPSEAGKGIWSGSAKSVTFTIGSSGQLQLNTFSVTVSSEAPTCATPTFSPAAGPIVSGTKVSISSTEGATIYYTTDGTTPTSSSSVYSNPIEITTATTIKAFAAKSNYNNSEVATTAYTIKPAISGYAIDFENDVDCYVDWTFENIGNSNTAITAHGGNKYGANLNESGNGVATASIQTKSTVALPGTFTCYVSKTSGNTTASTWQVQVSSDGSTWSDVGDGQSAISMDKGTWVEYTANLSGYSNVYVKLFYGSSTAIRAVDDISITMRDPNVKVTPTVTIDATALTTDLAGSTNVSAGTATATVMSGETAVEGAAVTWSSSNTGVATINATTGAITLIAAGTTTLTASFAGNDDYNEATATYELTVTDSKAPGGQNNPYTVAQALVADPANGVYVTGVVSEITEISTQYGNATYKISVGGSTEGDQLVIYRGKYLNNVNFTAETIFSVGDNVVVYGNLSKYNDVNQMAQNNYIVSLTCPEKPKHIAFFSVNGEISSTAEVQEEESIEFPSDPDDIYGKTFIGWILSTIDGETNTAPEFVTSATMGTENVTYYAVFATLESAGSPKVVTDVLTLETTGIKEGTTTYSDWSGKTVSSSAVYAGQSAGGNKSIQLRSSNSNSGIISTASGGKLKKIVVDWNSNTSESRRIRVYGKNTAYTAVTDVYSFDKQGTQIGGDGTDFDITYGTSSELTVDGDYEYIAIRSMNGALYLNSISITWENGTSATYSGYCTTVVAPVVPAAPIVFHDGDATYEGSLTVPMFAEEGAKIYYTTDGTEPTTASTEYTEALTISETTTVKAIAVLNGVKSDVVEKTFTIVPKETSDIDLSGYYTIQTNEEKYLNVAGRRTVTLNSDTKSAGTVLKVTVENGQVKELRSQAVDLPRYAERAMSYVPDLVKAIVKKLSENGVENNVIGDQGVDMIVEEFMNKFDSHLYLEQPEGSEGYRIYGKTPSMSLVVDFYAENKEIIDSRLPYLEGYVKEVLQKVVEVTGHGGSFVESFKIHNLWESMGGATSGLTEPVDGDAAAISKFYEEVLSSEKNVWDFAYQTAMIYWGRVEEYLNDPDNELGDLGDYSKYISRIKNVQPNFKYYLVPDASGLDIISEGNEAILNDNPSAAWKLKERTTFDVTLPVEKNVTIYPTTSGGESTSSTEYYGTLYTDFAYDLPEGVTAYKVDGINAVTNKSGVTTALVKKSELKGTIPAQTPVLLMADEADLTLTLNTNEGSAVESELHGTDWLINEYEINSPTVEGLFNTILTKLSTSLAEQYEYLQRRNSGTVNNKYLFGIAVKPDLRDAYKAKTGKEMENSPVRVLSKDEDGKVAFFETWDPLANNVGFMFSEEYPEILLSIVGDVNRDGSVTIADVTALVNIILGKAKYPDDADKYDFEAANVNGDDAITIADVTALVNIILGKN